MPGPWSNLWPWERRLVGKVRLGAVEKAIFPLFIVFILLNFSDALTTLLAATSGARFVEFNPLAAALFKRGFEGFMSGYLIKLFPTLPLSYMIFVRETEGYGIQVRLLRFTAFVILAAADIYLGYIVLANNLPNLLGASGILR